MGDASGEMAIGGPGTAAIGPTDEGESPDTSGNDESVRSTSGF
jgi:hypothetical protein